ncbi:MAG: hypothetical protein KDK89_07825 [Alphaproteobacteria bacterium]|nr:hypothetical protein [Alphaproteobacteria bacterium]
MPNFIKSLIGFERFTATPEESEAYRAANEALQSRVRSFARQGNTGGGNLQPTTDRFGRTISH